MLGYNKEMCLHKFLYNSCGFFLITNLLSKILSIQSVSISIKISYIKLMFIEMINDFQEYIQIYALKNYQLQFLSVMFCNLVYKEAIHHLKNMQDVFVMLTHFSTLLSYLANLLHICRPEKKGSNSASAQPHHTPSSCLPVIFQVGEKLLNILQIK